MATFEKMAMFEETIVCKSLPRSVKEIDKRVPIHGALAETPVNINISHHHQVTQQNRKQIRHDKRQMILKHLQDFESMIEEMEYVYHEELLTLERGLSSQTEHVETSMQCIRTYLDHRKEQMLRTTRYKAALLRMELKHPRHRSSTSLVSETISVYPEAIVETSSSVFTNQELEFLSSTGNIRSSFLASTIFFPFRWSELHQKESKLSLPQQEHSTKHSNGAVQNSCQTRARSLSSASRII